MLVVPGGSCVPYSASNARRWREVGDDEYREYSEEPQQSQRREGPAKTVQSLRRAPLAPTCTRRMGKAAASVVGSLCVALSLTTGCNEDDVGKPCGAGNNATFVADPIGGEVPVVEVTRIHRDAACQTFQCLTEGGLAPYCTRECLLDPVTSKAKECTSDDDCDDLNYCLDGLCRDDDCPKGFWCRAVQDAGYVNELGLRHCVRKRGCTSNFHCEDLGGIECRQMGCFDSCCRSSTSCEYSEESAEAGTGCQFHQLVCEPWSEIGCNCPDDGSACTCQPATGSGWIGEVDQLGVCMPEQK